MTDLLTIDDRVRTVIADHLGLHDRPPFDWEDELVDDLGADSLDLVELAMALEDEFKVEIVDDKVFDWRSAGDLLKTIEGLRS